MLDGVLIESGIKQAKFFKDHLSSGSPRSIFDEQYPCKSENYGETRDPRNEPFPT